MGDDLEIFYLPKTTDVPTLSKPTVILINIVFASCIGFMIPFMVYYGYKYYKARNHVALQQRYSSIVVFEVICTCLILFLYLIIATVNVLDLKEHKRESNLPIAINLIINITFSLLTGLWILRFWMIQFTMKHHMAINNGQWVYIVNKNSIQLHNHQWYLDKINTFGNLRWMTKYFLVPWVIVSVVRSILSYIMFQFHMEIVDDLLVTIVSAIPCILLIIFWCTFPTFKDYFFISDELRILITLYIIGFIPVIWWTFLDITGVLHKIEPISYYIFTIVIALCGALTSLISTCWVLKKTKSIMVPVNEDIANERMTMDGSISFPLICKNIKNKYYTMKQIQLKQILSNQKYFQVYIDHLSNELSIKYLLAFIEIVQLQKYIMEQNMENINQKWEDGLFHSITFYDSIPQSLIVSDDYNNNEEEKYEQPLLMNIKLKSNQLYKKYIEYGSDYESLLTKHTRNKISDVMSHPDWIDDDEYDINTILELWDDATNDLFILLLDGFTRFQTTLQYINLKLPRCF